MKACKRCGKEKEMKEFNNNQKNRDGKSFYCRECMKAANKAYIKPITKAYTEGVNVAIINIRKLIDMQVEQRRKIGDDTGAELLEGVKSWLSYRQLYRK
jgi:hypothetical protein